MAEAVVSAAAEFILKEFNGSYTESETSVTVGTGLSGVQGVTGNNPDRVGLTVINTGTETAYLTTKNPMVAGQGIILNANGGSVFMGVRDDLTLPSRTWLAHTTAGTTTLQVIEVFRYSAPTK